MPKTSILSDGNFSLVHGGKKLRSVWALVAAKRDCTARLRLTQPSDPT
jgi:hypothetical protein